MRSMWVVEVVMVQAELLCSVLHVLYILFMGCIVMKLCSNLCYNLCCYELPLLYCLEVRLLILLHQPRDIAAQDSHNEHHCHNRHQHPVPNSTI